MGRRATLSNAALSGTREPRTLSIPLWSVKTCPYGGSTSGNCHLSCRSLHARQYATAITSTATTAVEKMAMMMDEGVMGAGSGGGGGGCDNSGGCGSDGTGTRKNEVSTGQIYST